jgi:hypothetical protein
MQFTFSKLAVLWSVAFLFASAINSGAFALLGPIQPWMQSTNGVITAGDIGGPMRLTNEYRWNVPVVTYGFDKSFTDYFGSNGVAAVEAAIKILNDLPPAAQLVATNYPLGSQSYHATAQAYFIKDLKSSTLALLVEHLGLAQPTRNTYVMRQWNPVFIVPTNAFIYPSYQFVWPDWVYPNFISRLNFDPLTLECSSYVNGNLYSAYIVFYGNQNQLHTFPTDPSSSSINSAVADFDLQLGGYYTGLTSDDIGGLAYLLSTNNLNYETLLPGVTRAGTNPGSLVNGAWRPGVDKITFVRQPTNSSGAFVTLTHYFTDTFYSNGVPNHQPLARNVTQPDFLFSAGEATRGLGFFGVTGTGTSAWANLAEANGNANGAGPGVIQPPVQIVFDKFGEQFLTAGSISDEQVFSMVDFSGFAFLPAWGSFDGSTNPPVRFPIPQSGTNQMTVRMFLKLGATADASANAYEWKPTSQAGEQFRLQTSTNLANWLSLFTVTNNGSIITYWVENPKSRSRFYRLQPQ